MALAFRNTGEGGVEITVRDTGIGMTRQEIKTAMERFGQADSSYAKSTPGTGLGLPLVEGLVKLHDGHFAIESEKGKDLKISDIHDQVAGVYPRVMIDGDMDAGAWSCGMVAGLIRDIPSVKELIDRIMTDAERIIRDRLTGFLDGKISPEQKVA